MSSVLVEQLVLLQQIANEILVSEDADVLDEELLLIVKLLQCRLHQQQLVRVEPFALDDEAGECVIAHRPVEPPALNEHDGLVAPQQAMQPPDDLFANPPGMYEPGDLFADLSLWNANEETNTEPAAKEQCGESCTDTEMIDVRIEGAELEQPFHARITVAERDQLCETGRFHIRQGNLVGVGPGLDRWSGYLISYLEEHDDGLLMGVETESAYQAKKEAARRAEREREDARRSTYGYLRTNRITFDTRPVASLHREVASTMNTKAVAEFANYVSRLDSRFAAIVVRQVNEGKAVKRAITAAQAELVEASRRKVAAMRGLLRYRRMEAQANQ